MINSRFSLSGDGTLFAGEAFTGELAFADGDDHPIALVGRTFALTVYRKHDRTVLHSVTGSVVEGDDPHVAFAIAGSITEALYAQAESHSLMYEIVEVLASGKDVWVTATMRVLASALPIDVEDDDGTPANNDRITVLPTRRILISNRAPPPVLDFATAADVQAGSSTTKILTPSSLGPIQSALITLATNLIRSQAITARSLPNTPPV